MSQRWPDKLIIGLTGNIATGKSAVMKMAAERSALTMDADQLVHEILDSDGEAQKAILTAFGPQVGKPAGGINRKEIADIVFNDPVALIRLESIIHPRVRQRLWQRLESSRETIVFIEAIKLFEGGLAAECDQIWVTHCPADMQIERLMTYRHMDRNTAKMRVNAQGPQELKVAKADVVIDTAGSIDNTRAQFSSAWDNLAKLLAFPDSAAALQSTKKTSHSLENEAKEPETNVPAAEEGPATQTAPPKPVMPTANQDGVTGSAVIVRRARPTDIPAILLLIRRATNDTIRYSRGELLIALGDRGYLIGQIGIEINVIIGWHAENLVATIDQIFVFPAKAAANTGSAVLREVEKTAKELACEVVIAFPLDDGPEEVRQLLERSGFAQVDPKILPKAWNVAVIESKPENSAVMCKQLRDTRGFNIKTVSTD